MKFLACVLLSMISALANAVEPDSAEIPDTLEERAKPCIICHKEADRIDRDAYFPRIAGKPAGYLYNQLRNFRDGRRFYQPMAILLENMSDEYMQEIAQYFASLPYTYPTPVAQALSSDDIQSVETLVNSGDPARDLPACNACHGKALMGVQPYIPGLLGLPHAYVAAQFGGWRNGGIMRGQTPDCMSEIAKKLTQEEVNALAMWLPSQPLSGESAGTDALAPELAQRCRTIVSGKDVMQ
ncbi:cytochrome c4 [Nitrosomonas sp. JL21]|uniref:c-type cytochrome n=1 Tax=Nitrosomonas sp. JL21 TaxID=153949 RepID=UPI00136A1444|nr:cytochrome c4 [Nitrosomonas sp. JL21]MBL8497436.1 cytochrome c4 [Nitrosomonas sp.]MXS78681.1 cytochrome c4 [Nitrosomonas sp. JL21]